MKYLIIASVINKTQPHIDRVRGLQNHFPHEGLVHPKKKKKKHVQLRKNRRHLPHAEGLTCEGMGLSWSTRCQWCSSSSFVDVFFSRQKRHGFQLPIFSKEFPSSEAEKITGTRNQTIPLLEVGNFSTTLKVNMAPRFLQNLHHRKKRLICLTLQSKYV